MPVALALVGWYMLLSAPLGLDHPALAASP
jgi:hypothetical protein